MNNWILENIIDSMKSRIKILEVSVKYHEKKMQEYQDVFNTFDKFEAKYNEHHRTYKLALQSEIKYLRDQLEEIENIELDTKKKRAYCE